MPIADRSSREYQLLRDSPITVFSSGGELRDVTLWVAGQGYRVVAADAAGRTVGDVLRQIADQIPEWPPGYVSNLDGFDDGLRDFESPAMAFVLYNFADLASREPTAATHLLHALIAEAWWHLVEGRIVITLVESAVPLPTIPCPTPPQWQGWRRPE